MIKIILKKDRLFSTRLLYKETDLLDIKTLFIYQSLQRMYYTQNKFTVKNQVDQINSKQQHSSSFLQKICYPKIFYVLWSKILQPYPSWPQSNKKSQDIQNRSKKIHNREPWEIPLISKPTQEHLFHWFRDASRSHKLKAKQLCFRWFFLITYHQQTLITYHIYLLLYFILALIIHIMQIWKCICKGVEMQYRHLCLGYFRSWTICCNKPAIKIIYVFCNKL